jgi:hypothetical protein
LFGKRSSTYQSAYPVGCAASSDYHRESWGNAEAWWMPVPNCSSKTSKLICISAIEQLHCGRYLLQALVSNSQHSYFTVWRAAHNFHQRKPDRYQSVRHTA